MFNDANGHEIQPGDRLEMTSVHGFSYEATAIRYGEVTFKNDTRPCLFIKLPDGNESWLYADQTHVTQIIRSTP